MPSMFLTCWGSVWAPAPHLRWRQGWSVPRCRCRDWCNTLPAPLMGQRAVSTRTSEKPAAGCSLILTSAIILWKMLQRRMVWKTFEEIPCEMHCRLLFTKVFPCRGTAQWDAERGTEMGRLGRWTERSTHLGVESSSCVQEEFADFVHSVGVAG